MTPLLQATRTVPIVFVAVVDPVGAGYVDSLSRPGGNATGFMLFDYGLSAKWLELRCTSPEVALNRRIKVTSCMSAWKGKADMALATRTVCFLTLGGH
jgi:hypothetical protein